MIKIVTIPVLIFQEEKIAELGRELQCSQKELAKSKTAAETLQSALNDIVAVFNLPTTSNPAVQDSGTLVAPETPSSAKTHKKEECSSVHAVSPSSVAYKTTPVCLVTTVYTPLCHISLSLSLSLFLPFSPNHMEQQETLVVWPTGPYQL